MSIPRNFQIVLVAVALIVLTYVVAGLADVDLGGLRTGAKIVVIAAAAFVAAISYHSWSVNNNLHTTCAMALALLGGASLVSSVTSSTGADFYGSGLMAMIGTAAVVASASVSMIGMSRIRQ